MKNRYNLYEVKLIKGILMCEYINNYNGNNIIEAENYFDENNSIKSGNEYIITIEKI